MLKKDKYNIEKIHCYAFWICCQVAISFGNIALIKKKDTIILSVQFAIYNDAYSVAT